MASPYQLYILWVSVCIYVNLNLLIYLLPCPPRPNNLSPLVAISFFSKSGESVSTLSVSSLVSFF